MNRLPFSTLFPVAALLVTGAVSGDCEAISDHPLVSRFAGSTIDQGGSRLIAFDQFPLVLGAWRDEKFVKVQPLEGKITHLRYQNPDTASTLEIIRTYQNELQKGGFEILYTCGEPECGVGNTAIYDRWFGTWCNCGGEPMRYLAARLSRPEGDVYVSIKILSSHSVAPYYSGTFLNVIEVKPMDGGEVTVGAGGAVNPPKPAPAPRPAPVPQAAPPAPPAPRFNAIEIPRGTVLTVRMIDAADSKHDKVGKTFHAALDKPVNDAHGVTLLPRGTDVTVQLVEERQSGRVAGRTALTLEIVKITANGHEVDVDTMGVTEESGPRGGRSAAVIGGGAAAGGIIGGLAGGGTGAVIGGLAGAGAGTGAELATGHERVRVPSETRLAFRLQQTARF